MANLWIPGNQSRTPGGRDKLVRVISRSQAISLDPDEHTAFISIEDTEAAPLSGYDSYPKMSGWRDSILLQFDDIDRDLGRGLQMMRDDQALQLLQFLNRNFSSGVIVHCNAGVSRSVAVGTFMMDFLGYDRELHSVPDDEDLNTHVYKLLGRHYSTQFLTAVKRKRVTRG